jgi:hypothetical protein
MTQSDDPIPAVSDSDSDFYSFDFIVLYFILFYFLIYAVQFW